MKSRIVLDTGPVVALLNRRDNYHTWARTSFAEAEPPLLTCEAVLSDACLVRMAEQHAQSVVTTLDGDFRIYRKHGRQVAPTIMPASCGGQA